MTSSPHFLRSCGVSFAPLLMRIRLYIRCNINTSVIIILSCDILSDVFFIQSYRWNKVTDAPNAAVVVYLIDEFKLFSEMGTRTAFSALEPQRLRCSLAVSPSASAHGHRRCWFCENTSLGDAFEYYTNFLSIPNGRSILKSSYGILSPRLSDIGLDIRYDLVVEFSC